MQKKQAFEMTLLKNAIWLTVNGVRVPPAFVEAIEYTAIRRGIERWEP
jgi:hypothetical protein